MKQFLSYCTVSVGVALVLVAGLSQGIFFGSEHFFEDLLVSPRKVDSSIVIVAIDNESIVRIGQWPWPRAIFAQAFRVLDQAKPVAVGFDVMFSEKSQLGTMDDAALQNALDSITFPLVVPAEGTLSLENGAYRSTVTTYPLSQFIKNPKIVLGHVNLLIDQDGVVRSVPGFIKSGNDLISSFSNRIAAAATTGVGDPAQVTPIVYSQPTGGIRRISFYRLLEDAALRDTLRGKIVLIGATAPALHDEKLTPFSRGTLMPGVEIQANILNMLVSGYTTTPLSSKVTFFLLFLLSLVPAIIFASTKRPWLPLVLNIALGVAYNIAVIILHGRGLAANLIYINLAWALSTLFIFSYRYFVGEREKRELESVFSKYVSPAVLEKILQNPRGVVLGGEEKVITVLFSDIRGFTTLSEKVSPQDLVRILNRYFTLMTGEVLKYGGVLDKYIGDAVMAFWGAPLDDDEQANNALRASLGMLERLKEFNRELEQEEGITIDIGIGLYTGPAVVGNIGSAQRFDYTAMGDTVNVASRLEGLNKEYKTQLIIGEPTKREISDEVTFVPLGNTSVKGREEQITIYTVK